MNASFSFWQKKWQSGHTPWDLKKKHPELEHLFFHAEQEGGLKPGARIFSAGCGHAHSEAWLAEQGFKVTAIDIVSEAIKEAQTLYSATADLELKVGDIYQFPLENFDAAFDRAMLCAIDPTDRPNYVAAIARGLKSGGLFCGLLFRKTLDCQGPPFAVDEQTAWELFHDSFELCYAAPYRSSSEAIAVLEEWACIWRKN